MSNCSNVWWFFLVAFIPVFAGCRGVPTPEGFPKLYPVSIQFIQEGEPLAEASVILVPQDGSRWSSGAATDSKGVATFRTHGKYVGVPAGKYKVMIQKCEVVPKGVKNPEPGAYGPVDIYDLVNPNYFKPDKTPFEIEVVADKKKNQFEPIDLGKKVRILVPPIN